MANDKKAIGHWEGGSSFRDRYWSGACTCGSGREGHEVYDHHGIYFGISCSKCKREPRELGPGEDWDEQIEPE